MTGNEISWRYNMENIRKIRKVLVSRPVLEGAGVHLRRVFGYQQKPQLDPFLLLDDFHSDDPGDYIKGFPWHPHRGIETITYVLQGMVEHGDSMGNRGVIEPGDVQWMTAGGGVIHQEMPLGDDRGSMWGFQLWANLPSARKMMPPRYRDVKREDIPEVVLEGGVRVKIICGEVDGTEGPVKDIVIDPEYLDVDVPAGADFTRKIPEGYTVFAYVFKGSGYFEPKCDPYDFEVESDRFYGGLQRECGISSGKLVIYDEGDRVRVSAGEEGVRFLLVSGKPIGEPIAWYGPIVMNTQEELKEAFDEYNKGTFLDR